MYILLVVGSAAGGKRKVDEVEQLSPNHIQLELEVVTLVAEFERLRSMRVAKARLGEDKPHVRLCGFEFQTFVMHLGASGRV
jgi:hypothetical protein